MKRHKRIVALVVGALLLGLASWKLAEEWRLTTLQNEAVEQAKFDAGKYNEEQIVLEHTTKSRAEEIAEAIGARLRTTTDGTFAVLYLPEGMTVEEVYANKEYRDYVGDMSLDYYAYASELEEDYVFSSVSKIYDYNDTLFWDQNYLDYINLDDTWNYTQGNGVLVAVIDTGIDTDHVEFKNKISKKSYNASEDKIVADYSMSIIEDEQGHGTAVAGVIAATANNGNGIVGVAPNVELLVIKCECDEEGKFDSTSDLVFGLAYAIEQGADVVNMSFGVYRPDNPFEVYTRLAADSDIICVAAAGNDGSTQLSYPAADEYVIGVGAVDPNTMELTYYSNYGDNCDIVAPGTTMTTCMDGKYQIQTGTSLAAPIVSGGIALRISHNNYTEYSEVRELVEASGRDLGDLGADWYYGFGLFDVHAFVCESTGTLTYDMLTDEVENTTVRFVQNHTLQSMEEPERGSAIFEGWYYDTNFTEEYHYFEERLTEDITLYAKWINEDEGLPYSYVTLEDGTVEIRSYTGKRRYPTVPSTIEGKTVSSIGDLAFAENHRLRGITLPAGVTQIGIGAFQNCSQLTSVKIPDNVTVIEESAFEGCVRLATVAISENSKLTAVGNRAFAECGLLSKFYVPKNVSVFPSSALLGTRGLKEITVASKSNTFAIKNEALYTKDGKTLICYPAGKTGSYTVADGTVTIDACAFAYSAKEEIALPSSLAEIGAQAFAGAMIKKITVPGNVAKIGDKAFEKCYSLAQVTFEPGSKLSKIPAKCFVNCTLLKEISITDGVTTIESEAFAGSGIEKVYFGSGSKLETVGEYAFNKCYRLTSINVPKTVKKIQGSAFCECIALAAVTLPSGLEEIGSLAFAKTAIKSVELPNGVKEVSEGAFAYCSELQKISVASGNTAYRAKDGVLFDADSTVLCVYPAGKTETGYTVASGIQEIGGYAFAGADNLTSVNLPGGLQKISGRAFSEARKLEELTLPDSLEEIGEFAFEYCISLYSIEIPAKVVALSRGAFLGASNLWTITFAENSKLSRLGNSCLAGTGINRITIPASVTTMGQSVFADCNMLYGVTFEENSKLEILPAWCFSGSGTAEIIFEEGSALKTISTQALENLTRLCRLDLSGCENLEEIGNFALRGCSNLGEIALPESLVSIGRFAFAGCRSMGKLIIPENVEYIGRNAFAQTGMQVLFAADTYPEYLQEDWDVGLGTYYIGASDVVYGSEWDYVVLSDGTIGLLNYHGNKSSVTIDKVDGKKVSVLGAGLFAENKTLTAVALPATLTTIGKDVFKNTEKLTSIKIPASVTVISRSAFEGSGISSITFASGSKLETIEQYAFAGTKALKSISIPNSVEEIRSYAFFESALTKVQFGSSSKLATIGKSAFRKTKLTAVALPSSLKEIGAYAFSETQTMTTLDLGGSTALMIRDYAFYQSGMSKVTIPAGVTYIGEFAFGGCEKLTGFEVNGSNKSYSAKDGILFDKEMKRLLCCPANKTGTYEIPSSVLSLAYGAFEHSKLTEVRMGSSNLMTIGYRAFYKSAIKKVAIPDSLVSIGYYAFADCSSLAEVTFGEGSALNMIGAHAFRNCTAIKSISLPKGIEDLEEYSFYGCTALKELNLPKEAPVKGIGSYALAYTALTEFEIPELVEIIEQSAFAHMKIKEIVVPATVKEIGAGAFEGCNQLTDITLPFVGRYNGATDYHECKFIYIFGNLYPEKVKNVTLLETCTYIRQDAFYKCDTIEKVTCLGRVEYIEKGAFSWCDKLHYVSFADGVKVIGEEAFYLTDLYAFDFPDSVEEIGKRAFGQAFGWRDYWDREPYPSITLPKNLKVIGEMAFDQCRMTGVVLPEGLTTICDSAFRECTALKKINFPTTLTDFGRSVLGGCGELVIDIGKNHPLFYKQNGIVYNKDCTEIFAIGADAEKNIVIPEGVTDIGTAFSGSQVVSITLPTTLKDIKADAFRGCEKLETVIMTGGVKTIGANAFKDIWSLKKVVLPEGLVKIEEYAFENCMELTDIKFPDSLEEIEAYGFNGCKLVSVWIPKSLKTLGECAFGEMNDVDSVVEYVVDAENPYYKSVDGCLYSKDGKVLVRVPSRQRGIFKVPEGVEEIGTGAFERSNVSEVRLPETVHTIGREAFSDCQQLRKINIPSEVTKLLAYTFRYCRSLYELEIEGVLEEIEAGAFMSCDALLEEEDGVFYVGKYAVGYTRERELAVLNIRPGTEGILPNAFNGSSAVEVDLPEGLLWIGDGAFSFNTVLRSIVIPDTVVRMDSPFYYCDSLSCITYSNSLTDCTIINSQEYVALPDSVTTIWGSGDSRVKSLTIPKGLYVWNSSPYLETVILSETYKQLGGQLDSGFSGIKNLVIMSEDFSIVPGALNNVPNAEIFCMADRKDNSWVESGVEEGRSVHYKNEWYFASFYADGVTISSMPLTISEPIQVPSDEAVVKQNRGKISYTFVGWDINGDGKADKLPSLLTEDLNAVAVFEPNYCTGKHTYDYSCDNECNVCGFVREASHKEVTKANDHFHRTECTICRQKVSEQKYHVYACSCEENCMVCGQKGTNEARLAWEYDDSFHWAACPDCGKSVGEKTKHSFSGDCDAECDSCGFTREAKEHKVKVVKDNDTEHWSHCEWCGRLITDPEPHQYDCTCDTTCDECGYTRKTSPKTETKHDDSNHWTICADCDAVLGTKTKHIYSSACDEQCNGCEYKRKVVHQEMVVYDSTSH